MLHNIEDSITCLREHKYCIDVVGRILSPSEVHTLISKTCESVKLHGQEELRMQVELNLLITWPWGRESVLNCPGGPSNHKGPYKLKRKADEKEPERCNMGRTWCNGLEEDGGSCHGAKESKQPQEAGEGKNSVDSTLEPPEGMQPW